MSDYFSFKSSTFKKKGNGEKMNKKDLNTIIKDTKTLTSTIDQMIIAMHSQRTLVFSPMYNEFFLSVLDGLQKRPDEVKRFYKMLNHIDRYIQKENPKIATAHVVLALMLLKVASQRPLGDIKKVYDEQTKKSDVMYR
jgi:hypothetical protein